MMAIRDYIAEHHLTQSAAAKRFGVDQPQVHRLLKGKISYFSVDKLMLILSRVGIEVSVKIAA